MDSDFEILTAIANNSEYKDTFSKKMAQWNGSPFQYILSLSSRQRGKAGEDLLTELLIRKGCDVKKARNVDYDKIVNGYTCEIKMSTLWATGMYVFQQIRSTEWEYLLLLGLSPTTAHFWYANRDIIGHLPGQHSGKRGTDTRWIHLSPQSDTVPIPHLHGGKLSTGIGLFLQEIKT